MAQEIPINSAKQIAETFGYTEVVIVAYDKETGIEHVTTYGKDKTDCWEACLTGNKIKTMLGWPDELCNIEPERLHEL